VSPVSLSNKIATWWIRTIGLPVPWREGVGDGEEEGRALPGARDPLSIRNFALTSVRPPGL
jgi:hypothetical protein